MLARVTYIKKFIMAESGDEFMPIFVAASAAVVAMSQRKPRRKKHSKRFWSRPMLLRRHPLCLFCDIKYQTYLIPTADVVRASARCTTADATIFGTHITDVRPMPHDDRPMQNRPVGRLSEFPALAVTVFHLCIANG